MKGKCYYCNKEFSKSGVLKHLKTCQKRQEHIDKSIGILQKQNTMFILCVHSKHEPDNYWLYVSIDENATLKDLDKFLSAICLESSDNLSRFRIDKKIYVSKKTKYFNQEEFCATDIKLKNLIDVGYSIDYDFGDNTSLEIKVLDKFLCDKKGKKIELMAKNNEFSLDEETNILDEFNVDDYILKEDANKFVSKKWKKVKKDFSLSYHLSKLSKKELLIIGENLYLNKLNKLKKEELLNKTIEEYEKKLNMIIDNMDAERFEYIRELAKNNGYKESKDVINEDIIYYLSDLAIVFTGSINEKYVLIMPRETQQIILNKDNPIFKDQLDRNEEIIKIFWGMCYYYGALELNEFKRLVKDYIDYDILNININVMLEDASKYYDEFELQKYFGNHSTVDDPLKVMEEQNKNTDLEFYPFTKEQLLKVAATDYIDETGAYKEFHNFLVNNFDIDDESAEDLIFDFTLNIKNSGDMEWAISDFLGNFDIEYIELANLITEQVVSFANNTRQWAIKGYTPEEIISISKSRVKEGKVKRNDLCPCGSGKKYKKCCASNVIYLK